MIANSSKIEVKMFAVTLVIADSLFFMSQCTACSSDYHWDQPKSFYLRWLLAASSASLAAPIVLSLILSHCKLKSCSKSSLGLKSAAVKKLKRGLCFWLVHAGNFWLERERQFGAIIFVPTGRPSVSVPRKMSFASHLRAWQKACQHQLTRERCVTMCRRQARCRKVFLKS